MENSCVNRPSGLILWSSHCCLSFVEDFTIGITHTEFSKKENKSMGECRHLAKYGVFDCFGSPLREITKSLFIRKKRRRLYEIVCISDDEPPRLKLKIVKEHIRNFHNYNYI